MWPRLAKPKRLLGACALLLVLSSCSNGTNSSEDQLAAEDPGPIHIHGLGVNPRDDALFVATHTGLFRIAPGEGDLTRIADNYQDTMGFTVVGPDRFLGSGHPDLKQDLPPYLGLIESNDAGETWTSVSLEGEADFHVLEASDQRVYGFGSDFDTRREQLLVSANGGDRWQQLDPPASLVSLAIDPSDADRLVASGPKRLYLSGDAGATWRPVRGTPGLISWPAPGYLYSVDRAGRVAVTKRPGGRWQSRGSAGGEPAAFEAASAETLYVALHDGTIVASSDGGRVWTVRSNP